MGPYMAERGRLVNLVKKSYRSIFEKGDEINGFALTLKVVSNISESITSPEYFYKMEDFL